MAKITVLLIAMVSLILVACGSEVERKADDLTEISESDQTSAAFSMEGPAPDIASAQIASMAEEEFAVFEADALQVVERQVISVASVSMEVEAMQQAVSEVRGIAEGLGGFVEQLSSSAGDDRQFANITIRVPQDQFFTALEGIKALGEVQSENVGSEDVSEQLIDLEARLTSSLRQEQSFLSLLEKANTVGDILTIERELFRVRSEIERLQGQLNFLERRVALATITVSLFTPVIESAQPPSASLTVEASDVTGSVDQVKALVSILGGDLDGVFISIRDGKERADLSLRVFSADFSRALASIEGLGEVQSKELREGSSTGEETKTAEEPDAPITITLIEGEETSYTGLIIAIVAPIGSVAFVIVLGVTVYLVIRIKRSRAQTT